MNRVTFTICCVLLLSSQAVGLSLIGPATSDLDPGDFAIGIEYVKGDIEIGIENLTARYQSQGVDLGTLSFPGISEGYDFDGIVGKVSYGLSDRCLIFLSYAQIETSSDYDPMLGLGSKITLKEPEPWGLGLAAEIKFASETDDNFMPGWEYSKGEADYYAAKIALSIVHKSQKGRVRLYSGPFIFWADGDGDLSGRYISEDLPIDVKASFDVESEIELGGYIGLSIEAMKNLNIMVEYQKTKEWDFCGLGLQYKF